MCGMAITLTRIELFCSQISQPRFRGKAEFNAGKWRVATEHPKPCRRTEISSPFQWMRMMLFWKWRHDDWIGWIIDPIPETSIISFGDLLKSCCLALATAPQGYRPLVPPGFKHVTCQVMNANVVKDDSLAPSRSHIHPLQVGTNKSKEKNIVAYRPRRWDSWNRAFINKINQPHKVWEKLPCESVAWQWLDQLKGTCFFFVVSSGNKLDPADLGRLIYKFISLERPLWGLLFFLVDII